MKRNHRYGSRGFSLIEVLIAVVVLSVGLLALSSVQLSLFRAGAESRARANATAVAQNALENVRTFRQLVSASGIRAYQDIVTGALTATTLDGVTYAGCRQVRRYRYDAATGRFVRLNDVTALSSMFTASSGTLSVTCANVSPVAQPTSVGTPEFKEVRVAVGWLDSTGQLKTIELTDTVSSSSPADQTALARNDTVTRQNPTVWIRPPNRNDDGTLIPEVVPIAVSDSGDVSAASSNPKPEQFVEDLSAVTLFSVKTFTGTSTTEVLLNRNIDVAAASCICSTGGTSSATSPAYQPSEWNGKLRAYSEPATARVGKTTGTAVVSNADRQIANLCTICCRDHHDESAQALKVDPWRALDSGAHAHYGFAKSGNNYNIAGGLVPVGASTSNEYLEACRMVRVNGRMRLVVDAYMNYMNIAPLNAAGDGFANTNFTADYGKLVAAYIDDAITNKPAGYPASDAKLPAPTAARLAETTPNNFALVDSPATISFTSAGETRDLVAFGLYIDYLNADTLKAYECAKNAATNTADTTCDGLRSRNKLEAIPFYAVNLANLGSWPAVNPPGVVDVAAAQFDNQGSLASDGGIVTALSGGSNTPVPVRELINISNSGLASTLQIDPDDKANTSSTSDVQLFSKSGTTSNSKTLNVVVSFAAGVNINNLSIEAPAGTNCNSVDNIWTCAFTGNTVTVSITNFSKPNNDRTVCFPVDNKVGTPSPSGDGTPAEAVQVALNSLGSSSHTMSIAIINDGDACPAGLALN